MDICCTVASYGSEILKRVRNIVNHASVDFEPWQLILTSFLFAWLFSYLFEFLFVGASPTTKAKKWLFTQVKKIPFVKQQIDKEVAKTAKNFHDSFASELKPGMKFYQKLPEVGFFENEVLTLALQYKSMMNIDIHGGRASGTLYNGSDDLTMLNAKMYEMFAWSNPLHADVFPDVRKMEAEVVRMCVDMFHGDNQCCGTMTSGGTESIMLACKAYRDRAIAHGVKRPEILVPKSAHAAFEKAAQTFSMNIKFVPPNPETMKVDVHQLRKMITGNTCMIVCSAPDFPMGAIDPVEEVANLGKRYNIPVHVDACLGGFLIAFMDEAGYPLPLFDFRVDGVCSISCDTHKYGFAPKGSSVVLYKTTELRRHQYYVVTDWPGGIYATPALGGSRPGAIIAACWATLMYFGRKGYVQTTRKIIQTARYIKDSLTDVPGLFIYGDPLVSVLTFGSLDFDIYRLSSALADKGWSLNALQFPSSFHLCVTLCHTQPGVADKFIEDVQLCTAEIMTNPKEKSSGMAAIYGMSQTIPDRSLVADLVAEYLDALYKTDYIAPSKPVINGTHS